MRGDGGRERESGKRHSERQSVRDSVRDRECERQRVRDKESEISKLYRLMK